MDSDFARMAPSGEFPGAAVDHLQTLRRAGAVGAARLRVIDIGRPGGGVVSHPGGWPGEEQTGSDDGSLVGPRLS